ncbi:MAG: mechanosensitive ion channel family protein [Gemmatimonadetes bacterium]|nr:mechanosensitive ion channel family protein [Gemmatimonadota bacterium]
MFASLLAIITVWLVRRIVLVLAFRHVDDAAARYRIRKTSMYAAVPMGILLVGRIWFEGLQSIATFFGLLSAGLAIALKDLIVNLAGWAFILSRRPFNVGDRIQIGDSAGDVIDIRIFQFTLMEIGNWVHAEQSTGRILHVPNGKVLSEVLANYSRGFQYIWNEVPVLITLESDWRRAKDILLDIAQRQSEKTSEEAKKRVEEASRKFLISYNKLTPTVYTSVVDSGVLLTIRYLCFPRSRRNSTEEIWENILTAFADHDDIEFAYPTQRLYYNATEGKPGVRSDPDMGFPMPPTRG